MHTYSHDFPYQILFTTDMGIASLWLLVAGILWVMCWSGQKANGQQGMPVCREVCECGICDLLKDNPQILKVIIMMAVSLC